MELSVHKRKIYALENVAEGKLPTNNPNLVKTAKNVPGKLNFCSWYKNNSNSQVSPDEKGFF